MYIACQSAINRHGIAYNNITATATANKYNNCIYKYIPNMI